MALQLWIGNKNYSSWSMRAWVLMTELGIPFAEIRVSLQTPDSPAFRQALAHVSPAGKVPVLVDDGFAVWDTLAIAERLHERFPDRGVWPTDPLRRARARSLCAEMHSGFGALRSHCPMNIEADLREVGTRIVDEQPGVRADLQRLDAMWSTQLDESRGPMLFGAFGAADAFFAPVCMRIRNYGLPVGDAAARYVERVAALSSVSRWIDEALAEHEFLPFDEPYRSAPT